MQDDRGAVVYQVTKLGTGFESTAAECLDCM